MNKTKSIYYGICLLFLIVFSANAAVAESAKVQLKTSKGDIVIELDEKAAPLTAANFLSYVRAGFYDGTIFHRVISGFMIQGGGFTSEMQQKTPQASIQNEADNGLKNATGSIAMARTNAPHSATSQFFINTVDNKFLDHKDKSMRGWGYCVFGKVIQGMETVKAIEKSPTGSKSGFQDVPLETVIIYQATVMEEKTETNAGPSK